MRDVGIVVEARLRAADAGRLVEGAERAAFDARGRLGRPGAGLGDDVDDAADRVRAIEPALRAAQDLDAVDVGGEELREIERAVGRARIADIDAVDEHLGMIGVGAAHEDRGHAARTAGLHDIQAGHVLQHLGQGALLLSLDLVAGDDRDAAAELIFGRRHARRAGDDDRGGDGDRRRRRVLGACTRRKGKAGQDKDDNASCVSRK